MNEKQTPTLPPRSIPYLMMVAAYLALAAVAMWPAARRINPDGVAYLRIAGYWAEGRFGLAVNSYWGPLVSWLIAPFVALGAEPLATFKLLNVGFGLAAALGMRRFAVLLGGERLGPTAFGAGLLLALSMLPHPVSPDLLLTALVSWYLAESARALPDCGPGRALGIGLLGGLAYLTKAFALPFVLAHTVLELALRWGMRRAGLARGPLLLPAALRLVGLLCLALPWVWAISATDGGLTIGSSSKLVRAWSREVERREWGLPMFELQEPRAGRLTVWESPMEIGGEWPHWSPMDSPEMMLRQILLLGENTARALWKMRLVDPLWVMLLASLGGLLALLMRPRAEARTAWGWLRAWAFLSIGLYVGGYVLVLMKERYLWPVLPTLAALAVQFCALREKGSSLPRLAEGAEQWRSLPRLLPARSQAVARWAPRLLLLSLVGGALLNATPHWSDRGETGFQRELRRRVLARPSALPVATDKWSQGLYAAWWSEVRFLGAVAPETTPEELKKALAPYAPLRLYLFREDGPGPALSETPGFRLIERWEPEAERPTVYCFEYEG